jgi:hypothetical protein
MSHARAKRRLMQWERFHQAHPTSGKHQIGPVRYHSAHVNAHARVSYIGRAAPNGIREPWTLRDSVRGT